MKKRFNNLIDSIYCTLVFLLAFGCCIIFIYLPLAYPNKETNSQLAAIILSVLLVPGPIFVLGLLIWDSYSYWYIKDDVLYYKKPLRRRVIIPLLSNYRVERIKKSRLIFNEDKIDICVFEYNNKKAYIYFSESNKVKFESLLEKYISKKD